jgi:hypothetical protein
MRRPAPTSGYGVSARSPRSGAGSARTRHSSRSKTGSSRTTWAANTPPASILYCATTRAGSSRWTSTKRPGRMTSRHLWIRVSVTHHPGRRTLALGQGAHVWFFFAEPVPARDARDMASFLLTETMRLRRELKLESYDRLFPSQDTLPQGGFGNLIALPFQFHPRKVCPRPLARMARRSRRGRAEPPQDRTGGSTAARRGGAAPRAGAPQ